MKYVSCIVLLFSCGFCFACPVITLQVGPFFSTTVITKYWQDFALEIQNQLKCKVNIQASSSYEQYLDTLTQLKGDIFITPNHYVYALQARGLTPTLKSDDGAQIYILSRHQTFKTNPQVLAGNTLLVPSPYKQAYLVLLD